MSGVLDRLGRARKRPIEPRGCNQPRGSDLYHQQLLAAKEILAEVFSVSLSEVEEMIRQRCDERTLWPERFDLEE
jgi:hypothetical protein